MTEAPESPWKDALTEARRRAVEAASHDPYMVEAEGEDVHSQLLLMVIESLTVLIGVQMAMLQSQAATDAEVRRAAQLWTPPGARKGRPS